MNYIPTKKFFGLMLAVAIILPFIADHMGWWSSVLGAGALSTIVLVFYMSVLIISVAMLLFKTPILDKREKWIWVIFLVLAFPLISLALLYRLFWRPPVKPGL